MKVWIGCIHYTIDYRTSQFQANRHYNSVDKPSGPLSLFCIKEGLVDHVRVLCVEVNGTLVVGGRPSPRGIQGTTEIRETTESN